jgi:hypothetical protein
VAAKEKEGMARRNAPQSGAKAQKFRASQAAT